MTKSIIHTTSAPAAVGPYSQAVVAPAGTTVYLSGQIGLVPATGEMVSDHFEDQVRQAFAGFPLGNDGDGDERDERQREREVTRRLFVL